MATSRCKTFVKEQLNKLGIYNITVELGEVELNENISEEKIQLLNIALKSADLEIIEDKRTHLIKEIKAAVYDLINHFDDLPKPNYSEYISQKVNFHYTHLSTVFSKEQGISIEKYIIEQRIERVKELLVYSDLGLTDISFKLNFSSVAHLSNQFKKVTGLTPSYFREQAARIKSVK
jgi:AraC-like DNA-binding protein